MPILLFAIFLIGLLVRIPRFDYPIANIFIWGDGTRDYLVANHILTYHEFIKVGPYNYFFDQGILNSPLYFYLLALLLIPFNHILSLSLINIIFQMLVMLLIFIIGRKIFDRNVATVAIILYGLNPEIINQSYFLWQPSFMLIVALLALYFLLKSQNNLLFLHLSLILLSLAITIHNSALPWLLPFLIFAFLVLKKQKKKIYYFTAFSIIPLSLTIFYFPLFLFYLNNDVFKFGVLNAEILFYMLPNLYENFKQFLQLFNLNFIIGLTFIILFFAISHKKYLSFLALFILPFLAASFLSKVRMHYLTLSFPIFVLLSANLSLNLFQKIKLLKISLIVIIILIFSNDLSIFREVKKPLENYNLVMSITDKIIKDLQKIKAEKNLKEYDFFQVNSLMENNGVYRYPVLDTLFIVPLEKRLNTKLVTLTNISPYHHNQTNSRDYLIVPCIKISLKLCQDEFKKINQEYSLVKVYYSGEDYSVFLAKLPNI